MGLSVGEKNELVNIKVYKKTWYRLNKLKEYGESFDKVINRLVDTYNP